MKNGSRVAWFAVGLVLAACGPAPRIELGGKEEFSDLLSKAILDPTIPCEELQQEFDVQYLVPVADPGGIGLRFEEQWVVTRDLEVLRAWWIPARLNRGLVVFSQGSVGSMACYLFTTQVLADNGWSVVMYDPRGFGASSGQPDVETLPADLEDVVTWARGASGREKVTLMGASLGTIPSVALATQRPDWINAVILDSPVALGDEISRFGFLFAGDPNEAIGLLSPEIVSERIITALTLPLLVLQGEHDLVTPLQSVENLFARAGGPKEMVRFPGVEHGLAVFRDTSRYIFHVERFLSQVWGQAARDQAVRIEP
jgi:hypothetical protein